MKALYVRSLRMRLPLAVLALAVTALLRLTATLAWTHGDRADGLRAVSGLAFGLLLPLLGLSLGGSLFDAEELPGTFLWARPLARRDVLRARLAADLTLLALVWALVAGTLGQRPDGEGIALFSLGGTVAALVLYLLGGLASMSGLPPTTAAAVAAGAGVVLTLVAALGQAFGARLGGMVLSTTLGQVLIEETFGLAWLAVMLGVAGGCALALSLHGRHLPRRMTARAIALPCIVAAALGALSPVAHAGLLRVVVPQAAHGVRVRLHAPPVAAGAAPEHSFWLAETVDAPARRHLFLRKLPESPSPVGELTDVSPGRYSACATARRQGHGSDEYVVCREIVVRAEPAVQDFDVRVDGGKAAPAWKLPVRPGTPVRPGEPATYGQ